MQKLVKYITFMGVKFRKAPKRLNETIELIPSFCPFCNSRNIVFHQYWEEHKDIRVNEKYKSINWDIPGGWDLYCADCEKEIPYPAGNNLKEVLRQLNS